QRKRAAATRPSSRRRARWITSPQTGFSTSARPVASASSPTFLGRSKWSRKRTSSSLKALSVSQHDLLHPEDPARALELAEDGLRERIVDVEARERGAARLVAAHGDA